MKLQIVIDCLIIGAALLIGVAPADACTSVIVSGKVTPDGRPYILRIVIRPIKIILSSQYKVGSIDS